MRNDEGWLSAFNLAQPCHEIGTMTAALQPSNIFHDTAPAAHVLWAQSLSPGGHPRRVLRRSREREVLRRR
jgi:hypothetical protein